MEASERETRDRLSVCLARLCRLKPDDLVREETLGRDLSFRSGLPHFSRTLELYGRIRPRDLSNAPGEYLKIVADHAEDAFHRFEEILSFNPQGMENPAAVRNSLIEEVRDAYSTAYEDVALIIRPVRGQSERIGRQWSSQMMVAVLVVLVIAIAIAAHHYMLYNFLLGDLHEALSKIIGQH